MISVPLRHSSGRHPGRLRSGSAEGYPESPAGRPRGGPPRATKPQTDNSTDVTHGTKARDSRYFLPLCYRKFRNDGSKDANHTLNPWAVVSGYVLIAFLFFAPITSVSAQERPIKTRYVNLGVGYSVPKFLDNSFSALRYQGRAGSVNAGVYWATPDTTVHHHFTVRFDYGLMSAFAFEFADVNAFRLEGNYQYERYVRSLLNNRVRWYAGGAFNSLWTLWQFENFSNNSLDNSFYFSLSPATSLEYPFTVWKKKFRVTWSAFLPLLTVAVRPSYGTTRFPGFLDDDRDEGVKQFLESTKIVTLNRYFRYSNTLALEYYLKNNNRLRLGYTWNYQSYDEPRLVQSASHNISISTMFNF